MKKTLEKQERLSQKLKEQVSIVRQQAYENCIQKYPLYSILLVLDEYVKKEWYEECSLIKKALDKYNSTRVNTPKIEKLIGQINFPTTLEDYTSIEFQNTLRKYDIVVEKEFAEEKATIIKLKIPVNGNL